MKIPLRLFTTCLFPLTAFAHELPAQEVTETIVVTGKAKNLLGTATSASIGQANNAELSQRPVLRRGELLEAVPGVIITQHAGGGKSNQFFLRGYNLDHGTDFNVSLDGLSINNRSHTHGQGYTDLNFLVPEFIEGLDYSKGPYFTALGDLSSTGGANYRLFHELPQGIASFSYGKDNYYRAVVGDSFKVGPGILTLGGEYSHEDGPWDKGDNFRRFNGLARYHLGDDQNFLDITAMAYHGKWNSSDQLAERAIRRGIVSKFGSLDDTTGGDSGRYSLAVNWQEKAADTTTRVDAIVGHYDLDLFSNFTYFLEDPVRGDQFEQQENRWFTALNASREWRYDLATLPAKTTLGFQTRHDFIAGTGLYKTEARRRFRTIREDDVYEGSYGLYVDQEVHVTDWFRAGAGVRGDLFNFDVSSDDARNSGDKWAGMVSPKARLVFGPWADTEFYLNGGLGLHSNDARGTVISIDPATGQPADEVDALVRTRGAEFGIRSNLILKNTATVAFWVLESDSEFVYVGDAGATEAGPASRRYGVELSDYYRPTSWLTLDVEAAFSHARFTGVPDGEDEIPGAIDTMFTAGLTIGEKEGWYATLRARYFGPRPLEESGSIESKSSLQFNARIGYRKKNWEVALDCLNLFDRDDNDIEYYYESRLASETVAVNDIHLHPAEPRQLRLTATYHW